MSRSNRPHTSPALFSLAVVALVFSACSPAPTPEAEPTKTGTPLEDEVRKALEAYYDSFSSRDWDRFQQHFWPGAIVTTIWTPSGEEEERVVATTVPEFVAQAPEGPGSREVFEEKMVSAEITVEGPLAQAWARYEARFGDPGEIFEWSGIDTFSLLKHDGQWRIVSVTYAADGG